MRQLALFVLIFASVFVASAQQQPPAKLTASVTAFGVTVYYPPTMYAEVREEIYIYSDNPENSRNKSITIAPPQSLADFWDIPQSDVSTMIQIFYDLMQSYYSNATALTKGIEMTTVGDYDVAFFSLQTVAQNILTVYMFETPAGIFSTRLWVEMDNYAEKLALMHAIIKAMDISSASSVLPEGVLERTAPTIDVRMGERITSMDATFTYQMPIDWVRDTNSNQPDVIANSQATLDAFNDDFRLSTDGVAIGFIQYDALIELGITARNPYHVIKEFRDLLLAPRSDIPIYKYIDLPYQAYIVSTDTRFIPGTHFIVMQIADTDQILMLFILTSDLARYEASIIAVMNSIRLVPRR